MEIIDTSKWCTFHTKINTLWFAFIFCCRQCQLFASGVSAPSRSWAILVRTLSPWHDIGGHFFFDFLVGLVFSASPSDFRLVWDSFLDGENCFFFWTIELQNFKRSPTSHASPLCYLYIENKSSHIFPNKRLTLL